MEFAGRTKYIDDKDGKEYPLRNYMEAFSDTELKSQIDRFIHGYSNRFIPIEIPAILPKGHNPIYMKFFGRIVDPKDVVGMRSGKIPIDTERSTISNRKFTWCDAIYIAVSEAVKDKTILVTRFPMDSYFNQFPAFINIASTIKTESVILDGKLYPKYPYIRDTDMGTDTSNLFVDTANIPNIYLDSIGGDYKPIAIVVFDNKNLLNCWEVA
jgi:hypothetical protein